MSKELQLDVLTALKSIVSKIDDIEAACPEISAIRGWGSYSNKPSAYFVFCCGGVSCDVTIKAVEQGKDKYLSWRLSVVSGSKVYAELEATPIVNDGCTPSEFERTVLRVHHSVFDRVSDALLTQYDAESFIYSHMMSNMKPLQETLRGLERTLIDSLSE